MMNGGIPLMKFVLVADSNMDLMMNQSIRLSTIIENYG